MSRPQVKDNHLIVPDFGRVLRESLLLLVVAVLAALITWAVRGDKLPLAVDRETYELEVAVPVLEIAEAIVLFDEGDHLFIDTRPVLPEGSSTVLGAFRIRAATFDDDLYELVDTVYPEDPIVLFGDGNLGGVAHVADLLLARGYSNVSIMRGSVAAWGGQGGEVSPAETAFEEEPGDES